MVKSRRFLWLDGSRGVAATAVMIYHFREYLDVGRLFGSSYLAVDLFFMMSGFVLAHAYGDKLIAGMSFGRFFVIRVIRLYPLFLAATAVGLSYHLAKVLLQTDDAPAVDVLVGTAALNLLFLPSYSISADPSGMFPFAPTSWSLSVEVVLSVLFAAVLFRLRRPALALVTGVSALLFVIFAARYGTVDLGWDVTTFAPSLFRGIAEFAAGMLICRAVTGRPLSASASRWPAAATFGGLIAILVVIPSGFAISFVTIAIVFPLAIVFQASSEPGRMAGRLCEQLGRGSYPIYLLHTPVLLWGVGSVKMLAPTYASNSAIGLGLIAVTLLLSYLCAELDERFRNRLSALIRRREPVAAGNRVKTA